MYFKNKWYESVIHKKAGIIALKCRRCFASGFLPWGWDFLKCKPEQGLCWAGAGRKAWAEVEYWEWKACSRAVPGGVLSSMGWTQSRQQGTVCASGESWPVLPPCSHQSSAPQQKLFCAIWILRLRLRCGDLHCNRFYPSETWGACIKWRTLPATFCPRASLSWWSGSARQDRMVPESVCVLILLLLCLERPAGCVAAPCGSSALLYLHSAFQTVLVQDLPSAPQLRIAHT